MDVKSLPARDCAARFVLFVLGFNLQLRFRQSYEAVFNSVSTGIWLSFAATIGVLLLRRREEIEVKSL